VLLGRQGGVNRPALTVRHDALRHTAGRAANQGDPLVHDAHANRAACPRDHLVRRQGKPSHTRRVPSVRRLRPVPLIARRLSILVVLMSVLPAGVAHGATFTVNSAADEVDLTEGDNLCLTQSGTCTLRAATQEANVSAGDDVINLPAGDAPERVTVTGAGARTTRIIGVAGDRVLHWTDEDLTVDISGVAITGGSGVSSGGGIDGSGTFSLTNVAVTGNQANNPSTLHNQGGGIFNQGAMTLVNVTLSGNTAAGPGNPQGGGLFDLGNGNASLTNVTISGNSVATTSGGNPQGGGMFYIGDIAVTATLRNVTIAGNTTNGSQGGGFYTLDPISLGNTIIALNRTAGASPVASNCAGGGGDDVISLGHNLDEGNDCNFTATTDLRNADPLLGALQDNGGQIDTRALLPGSPAIDTGNPAACPATDARGTVRPSGAGCDIGAFEVFVPAPPPPPPPPPPDGSPTPELGRVVVARAVSGRVTIATRLGGPFIPLEEASEIPVGAFVNARRGTVRVTSAVNSAGATQSGNFSRGLFQVLQSRRASARGLTELVLKGSSFRSCRARGGGRSASAAQLSRRTVRRLRANARGRFRTRGRNSSATVRGTVWETIDRCDGTLTNVRRGRVAVRDFRRKRTVLVRAGKSYLARARR
jgi:CSLREA domain-containing protein